MSTFSKSPRFHTPHTSATTKSRIPRLNTRTTSATTATATGLRFATSTPHPYRAPRIAGRTQTFSEIGGQTEQGTTPSPITGCREYRGITLRDDSDSPSHTSDGALDLGSDDGKDDYHDEDEDNNNTIPPLSIRDLQIDAGHTPHVKWMHRKNKVGLTVPTSQADLPMSEVNGRGTSSKDLRKLCGRSSL
jgi:hypothetical protein